MNSLAETTTLIRHRVRPKCSVRNENELEQNCQKEPSEPFGDALDLEVPDWEVEVIQALAKPRDGKKSNGEKVPAQVQDFHFRLSRRNRCQIQNRLEPLEPLNLLRVTKKVVKVGYTLEYVYIEKVGYRGSSFSRNNCRKIELIQWLRRLPNHAGTSERYKILARRLPLHPCLYRRKPQSGTFWRFQKIGLILLSPTTVISAAWSGMERFT